MATMNVKILFFIFTILLTSTARAKYRSAFIKEKEQLSRASPDSTNCFVDGVSYKGDPVRGIKGFHISDITSAEECQQECVQDSDCQFWTWNSPAFKNNPDTCWLKAGKGDNKKEAGKISGPKICGDDSNTTTDVCEEGVKYERQEKNSEDETPEEPEEPKIDSLTPVECNKEICSDRCPMGNTEKGFTTYTFKFRDQQYCFTVYHPKNRMGEKLPVVMTAQCYAKNQLKYQYANFASTNDQDNMAAQHYGFARIQLTTPNGKWYRPRVPEGECLMTWENPSAACDLAHINPDGKVSDLGYAKTVVDWIYSNPDLFDTERIYVEGFSQNSGYAGFIMTCLSERITGGWGPGAQECGMKKRDRGQWPCYSEKGPLIMCKGVYLNNYKYENQTDGYDCLIKEGHDPRIFEFRPQDGTIEGKHNNIENRLHWAAGCWGLTPFCSKACEATFFDCMDSTGKSTEKIRTQSFRTCIMELEDTPECIECSPTLDMLREGQKPTYEQFQPGHFGAIDPTENHARDNFPESHCDQRDAPNIFN